MFYVYIIFRENGMPCYVGKGQKERYAQHEKASCNIRLKRLYAKTTTELPIVIVRDGMNESAAFALEMLLIKTIGRADLKTGPLFNLTDGGDGPSGRVLSKKTRQQIAAKHVGKKISVETRAAMSKAGKGKKHSISHGKAIGDALRGKPKSKKHIQNMLESFARTKGLRGPSVKNYYASLTPEQKAARAAKISARTREAMASADVKARMIEGYRRLRETVH